MQETNHEEAIESSHVVRIEFSCKSKVFSGHLQTLHCFLGVAHLSIPLVVEMVMRVC